MSWLATGPDPLICVFEGDRDGEANAAARTLGRALQDAGFDHLAALAERHLAWPATSCLKWQEFGAEAQRHAENRLRWPQRNFVVPLQTWPLNAPAEATGARRAA